VVWQVVYSWLKCTFIEPIAAGKTEFAYLIYTP